MLNKWLQSELHDAVMNLVAVHARNRFQSPVYVVDEHVDQIRKGINSNLTPNLILELEKNSPVYEEFMYRFFARISCGYPDIPFVKKIGDLIVAKDA